MQSHAASVCTPADVWGGAFVRVCALCKLCCINLLQGLKDYNPLFCAVLLQGLKG